MPFWFDAYWLDCSHLSDAEHGRYLLVMKQLWTAPQQRIPNDDEWLARRFRRTPEAVRAEIRPILQEFCQCDGNWWTQKRLSEEFSYVIERSRKQSARAKSAWQKRKAAAVAIPTITQVASAAKRGGGTESGKTLFDNENVECRGKAPTPTLKESIYTASKPPKAAPNGAGHSDRHVYQFDAWWACWDITGTKKDRAAAERKYRAAIKADAATHEELCAAVRRYMAWCRKERREVRYIKAPDVWLNKGCWADELGATGPPPQRRPFEDLSNYTAENYPPQPPVKGST